VSSRRVIGVDKRSIVGKLAPVKGHKAVKKRLTLKIGKDRIIKNLGVLGRKILIGMPTLGAIRIETSMSRQGQIIPINWQSGSITAPHQPPSVISEGYHTADAQNTIVERAVLDKYQYLLLTEDDVMMPLDTFMRFNQHMIDETAPIISGLYFSKGEPTWPLVFRGRGNGAYTNFNIGDKVWCDGVPTGLLLIHGSILQYMWENSPEYKLPDGRKCRQVFKFPREAWYDPELDRFFSTGGTSDIFFCDRIIKEKVFAKTGWPKFAKMKYPFLCDTAIYAAQIDIHGKYYPHGCEKILMPHRKKGNES
jgi:hypothetical protein